MPPEFNKIGLETIYKANPMPIPGFIQKVVEPYYPGFPHSGEIGKEG
jgi:hypothetical protein